MTRMFLAALFTSVCSLAAPAISTTAFAAEIRVLSAAGVRPVLIELGATFERTTGHKLALRFVEGPLVKREVEAGAQFDVALTLMAVIDDLVKGGRIVPDTRVDFARGGLGVGVRAGTAKPDIGSVDSFKRTLLNAKSVTYAGEGATGIYFTKLLDRLGIAAEMKPKLKPMQSPAPLQAVAKGEAELVVGAISPILATSGVELAGPLPGELQTYIRFAAGVGTAAKDVDAARALVKFLTSPEAAQVITAKGMEPLK